MKKKALSLLLVIVMTTAIVLCTSLPISYASSSSMKVIVPAYFGANTTYWSTLTTQAGLYPGKIYAIINVANGPGTAVDSNLLSLIINFRAAGGKILGYVNTYDWPTSTFIPEATVKLDVDRWYNWYKNSSQVSQMDGIFYDQMNPWNGGQETFYRSLYTYVKGKDTNDMVIGNPGGNTSESYVQYNGNRLTDVICTFESPYSTISSWPFQPWQANYSYDRFFFLPYATSSGQMQDAVNQAAVRNYGWFYCTDDTTPNPWDTLPSFFAQMCSAVNAVGSTSITVNGNASDWSGVSALATGSTTVQTLKATNNSTNLYLLIQGTGLNVKSNFFIDTDNNSSTGYNASGWAANGSDYMIENNILYHHNGGGWSWTAVATLSSSQFVKNSTVIEVGVPLSSLGINTMSTIRVGFIKNDSSTNRLPGSGGTLPAKTLNP